MFFEQFATSTTTYLSIVEKKQMKEQCLTDAAKNVREIFNNTKSN